MMSLELAKDIHHKYRKAIRVVQDHIKSGKTVSQEELVKTYGWSPAKARDTLTTMALLGILVQQPQPDEAARPTP